MFTFTDLTEGGYRLEFSDDVNRFWVANADGDLVFDNTTEDVATRELVLNYGENVTGQDAGYAYGAAISGYIFNDDNYNGMYDLDTELPEPNASVHLIGNDGIEVGLTSTDSNGHYGFTNLEPGLNYSVVLDNQDNDGDGDDDFTVTKTQKLNKQLGNDMFDNNYVIETRPVTLNDNEVNDIDFDGGITYKTSLSGYVYEDKNIDSTYNEQDVLLDDVEVSLIDSEDVVVATTTTKDGYYQFTNVVAGEYSTVFGLEQYNVSAKGAQDTKYANDMNDQYATDFTNVLPKQSNDVSFDAAVYTDQDQADLDQMIGMELGNTGRNILIIVCGLLATLVGLVIVKKRLN